jgi:hypothetical protein
MSYNRDVTPLLVKKITIRPGTAYFCQPDIDGCQQQALCLPEKLTTPRETRKTQTKK